MCWTKIFPFPSFCMCRWHYDPFKESSLPLLFYLISYYDLVAFDESRFYFYKRV